MAKNPTSPEADSMTDTAVTTEPVATVETTGSDTSEAAIKSRFSRAIEDARASAETLRTDAIDLTVAAGEAVAKKAGATAAELSEQASALASQARDKSLELARQGKDKTSEAIAVVGRAISDTAPVIDEKLGVQYGDYARAVAGSLEVSADKLASKDIADLGEDVTAFVRKSPATALGLAAVAGFLVARMFTRSGSRDA